MKIVNKNYSLIIVGPLLGFFVDKKGALFFLRIVSLILMVPGILLTFFTINTIIFMGSFVISVLGLCALYNGDIWYPRKCNIRRNYEYFF